MSKYITHVPAEETEIIRLEIQTKRSSLTFVHQVLVPLFGDGGFSLLYKHKWLGDCSSWKIKKSHAFDSL